MLGGREEWPEKSRKIHVIKLHTTTALRGKDMSLPAIQMVANKLRPLIRPLRVGRDKKLALAVEGELGEQGFRGMEVGHVALTISTDISVAQDSELRTLSIPIRSLVVLTK